MKRKYINSDEAWYAKTNPNHGPKPIPNGGGDG